MGKSVPQNDSREPITRKSIRNVTGADTLRSTTMRMLLDHKSETGFQCRSCTQGSKMCAVESLLHYRTPNGVLS